jgi:PAS domain S-box-containing protein
LLYQSLPSLHAPLNLEAHTGSFANEQGLVALIESSVDGYIVFDASTGEIVRINPPAESMLDYPRGELRRRPIATVFPALAPKQRDRIDAPESTARAPSTLRIRLQACRHDGSSFPCELTLTSIALRPPTIVARIAVLERHHEPADPRPADVPRVAPAEPEVRDDRATMAIESSDEFLSTLSHELRTPLNSMLGWTQILRAGPRDEATTARALETIERNIRVMTQLVDDLLDASVLSGTRALDLQPQRLAPLVENALARESPAASVKDIAVNVRLGADVTVLGDSRRLRQIVRNLMSNAIRFTPRGGHVEVTLEQTGDHVDLRVRDDGEGIDPEFLPIIFERFRQSDSSTTRRHGGLGLGLYIARLIVELHDGSIRARSAGRGRGAEFLVTLPAIPSDRPVADDPGAIAANPTPATGTANTTSSSQSLAGMSVLVIDDEEDAREYLRWTLESRGARVFTAATAADGLRILGATLPTLIVCDIAMPGEDGHAYMRNVRALAEDMGGRTPAAALSAFGRGEDRRKSLEAGFQIHLTKPIEPVDLVQALLDLKRAGVAER